MMRPDAGWLLRCSPEPGLSRLRPLCVSSRSLSDGLEREVLLQMQTEPRLNPQFPHLVLNGMASPFPGALRKAFPHPGHFQSIARRCTKSRMPP